MKRTSIAILLLAGLGGGCVSADKKTVEGARPFNQASTMKGTSGQAPNGAPIQLASATMPAGSSGVVRADGMTAMKPDAGFTRISGSATSGIQQVSCPTGDCGPAMGGMGNGLPPYGPTTSGLRNMLGQGGIVPVPAMGMPGAVAFPAGMGGPGSGMYPGMYMGGRSQVRFVNPAGMKITWQTGGGFSENGLEAPARYNFAQANMYRLRLSGIPNRPGKTYYPTLEVYPANQKTITFLSHNTVPVSFTDEDFDQVNGGNLVVKVIYLPDEKYQDLVPGVDEVVSTRLELGANPIEEANRRGTILAVIRIGNADLQDPNTPPLDAPVGGMSMAPMKPAAGLPSLPSAPVTAAPVTPVVPTLPGTLPSSVKVTVPAKPVSLPR
ncbi:MAG: hypothetical protein ACRC8S_10205 [Fimbriiglobus sp.]